MIIALLFDPIIRDKAVLERTIVGYVNLIAHRHGCQNRDLDRRIARFYDPTSPKRLESH